MLTKTKDGKFAVRTAYDKDLIPKLRGLPGARWNRTEKVWELRGDLPALVTAVSNLGLPVDEKVLDELRRFDDGDDVRSRARTAGLYPFQVEGAAWLSRQQTALLADEMGTGKTIQTLLAIDGPTVVVCPAGLKRNWEQETTRWRPDLNPTVLVGRGSFRWPAAGEVVITSYEILPPADEAAPATARPALPTTLVADEGHGLKNRKTRRAKAFGALREHAARVWILTGSPLLNRPLELWGMIEALGAEDHTFGHFGRFYRAFGATKTRFGTTWGQPSAAVPGILSAVMLRRLRTEVIQDLPSKTWRDLPVEITLPAADREICDEAHEAWLDDDAMPAFDQLSAARKALATAKIPAVTQLVEDFESQGEPVVVVSAYRAPVEALGEREGWGMIHGGISTEDRHAAVSAFQRGDLRGIAMTIGAGGVGITLTRASHMIQVDQDWTPARNSQVEDRIYRIGQTRAVLITRLIADHPIDRRLTTLLGRKQRLIDATVQSAGTSSRDAALAKAKAATEPEDTRPLVAPEVAAGRYAITAGGGQTSFYVVETSDAGRWAGWTFLKHQLGGDLHKAGGRRPDGTATRHAAVTIFNRIAEDPVEAMRRYGMELGICGRCNRALTNDLSREFGIGPICRARMGISDADAQQIVGD